MNKSTGGWDFEALYDNRDILSVVVLLLNLQEAEREAVFLAHGSSL